MVETIVMYVICFTERVQNSLINANRYGDRPYFLPVKDEYVVLLHGRPSNILGHQSSQECILAGNQGSRNVSLNSIPENVEMIILLLLLAYSMSEASADKVHTLNTERPDIDIVRQLDYIQRISKNQRSNVTGCNERETGNRNRDETKRVNVTNGMSVNRINTLRKYLSGRTVELCDFTCHNCYKCSLVHDK